MQTVKFYTLGCKVNQYETQIIREQFQKSGFRELGDNLPADIYIINTCTVTHRADSSSLYLIRRAYQQNPNSMIIVTGCLTQFDTDRITSLSGVGLVVGNKDKHRIISLLYKKFDKGTDSKTEAVLPTHQSRCAGRCGIPPRGSLHRNKWCRGLARPVRVEASNGARGAPPLLSGITYFKNHCRAFVKIQDGCNYNCSYCKVRLVRGKSCSRKPDDIKKEIDALVINGYLEIVLCGICLGSYGRDLTPRFSLDKLIEQLQEIQGLFRIRLSSIELNDITDELLNIMKESNRVCRHLHIPVQSGDGQILKRMNRTYSPEAYIKLTNRIKKAMPDIAITTDVMVGFPGETEIGFKNTVELINEVKPSRIHIFPYSRRIATPAYNLRDFVPERNIKLRTASLIRINQHLRLEYCKKFISKRYNVLIERKVPGSSNFWDGYTENYIKARVKSGLNLENQIIQTRIRRIYKEFALADIIPGQ